MEEVPKQVKRPAGVVFHLQELAGKSEEEAINLIRHEIEYLFSTDLYFWRLGQRKFFRFGFTPTSFLVLYAVLESIKADSRLIRTHRDAEEVLKRRYQKIMRVINRTLNF